LSSWLPPKVIPNPTTETPALRTELQGPVGLIAGANMAGAVVIRLGLVLLLVIDCDGEACTPT